MPAPPMGNCRGSNARASDINKPRENKSLLEALRMLRVTGALGGVLLLACADATAQRADLIFLVNGDRITGEIESLEAGILEISTDTTSNRILIEWRFVEKIVSDTRQSVELTDGRRLLGPFRAAPDPGMVLIETRDGLVPVRLSEMVAAWPVEASFWENFELDLSFGLSYASSTEIGTYTLGLDASYLSADILFDARFRSELTRQNEADETTTTRNAFELDYTRNLEGLRYRSLLVELEQNDAIGIDLRVLGGGALGRYLIKENQRHWRLGGGLVYTYELPESGASETNLEALLTTRFRYFRFASPERDIDARINIFPSLTDFGRIRADFRTTFTIEITGDLDWALEGFYRFDSDPVSDDGDRADYGLSTLLKYSF
jgi:hypothetical protein